MLALLAGGWSTAVQAGDPEAAQGKAERGRPDGGPAGVVVVAAPEGSAAGSVVADAASDGSGESRFSDYSDEALTGLAARWDSLDLHQRRALLTEVRSRMARRGSAGAASIQIRSERRYGRIIRQPDGRVIRIETQIVHVRPATEAEVLAGRAGGFGVGFERRAGAQPPAERTPEDGGPGVSLAESPPSAETLPKAATVPVRSAAEALRSQSGSESARVR